MFTLKFISSFDNGLTQDVVCCHHYCIDTKFMTPNGETHTDGKRIFRLHNGQMQEFVDGVWQDAFYLSHSALENIYPITKNNYKDFNCVFEVTIYKDMTKTEGVSYHVSEHPLEVPHHQVCYVENVHGKTIERFGSLPKK